MLDEQISPYLLYDDNFKKYSFEIEDEYIFNNILTNSNIILSQTMD